MFSSFFMGGGGGGGGGGAAAQDGTAAERLQAKLKEYKSQFEAIGAIFKDNQRTTFVCVCIAELLSVCETERLVAELRDSHIGTAVVLCNQLIPPLEQGAGGGLKVKAAEAEEEAEEEEEDQHPYIALCEARRKIQLGYLLQLKASLGSGEGGLEIIGLPLLPHEVRGAPAFRSFSQRILHPADFDGSSAGGGQGEAGGRKSGQSGAASRRGGAKDAARVAKRAKR